MVAIEEVVAEEQSTTPSTPSPSPSQERMLDVEAIEKLVPLLQQRPTAKIQLEAFVAKLKKEASAFNVIESTATATATATATTPVAPTATVPAASASTTYTSIDTFAFDAGGSSDKFVTLYLPLPGVGSKKQQDKKDDVHCVFEKNMFDVTVMDLAGKNYRLIRKNNLEHNIDPDKSKYIIKAEKIVVKLAKIKGEYGSYDYWSKLTDNKKGSKAGGSSSGSGGNKKSSSDDPQASIMNMMKDMYESGDDSMKKMIGETMLKQRNGELNKDKDDLMNGGMGGMGGMGDLGM